jgi:bifunctional UDP-N-acetylglucosamine pyrophosphorylase/glucosamine-1-phosphate N-acetyltransferase
MTLATASRAQDARNAALAVVLAAGEGTRMKSGLPKVLHRLAGGPMIGHVLAAIGEAGIGQTAVVIGPGRPDVAEAVKLAAPGATVHIQAERKGTAHAVLAARSAIETAAAKAVVVVFGDTPLVKPETLGALCRAIDGGAAVVALGFHARDPDGYGRFVIENGQLAAIVEQKDASAAQKETAFCNAGLMALAGERALPILDAIGNRNAQTEFYLTDAVSIARKLGLKVEAIAAPEDEVMGINDRVQLATAEALMQQRLRDVCMRAGATMIDPASVSLCHDTRLGQDVIIEPNVVFGPGVSVEDDVVIRAFSHIEGAVIRSGARVGPFARLRPGTEIGAGAHIGNFVEAKAASIGAGAKANHLAYIGDASVGAKANIGAGTITCNYDGFNKHRTEIGEGAFIGSNAALVAPVRVGAGAIVGAGSVVTREVPGDALAVERSELVTKSGWAARFRATQAKKRSRS